jgi:hypothetical protein
LLPLLCSQCTDVKVVGNGVVIDYDPIPFLQATALHSVNHTHRTHTDRDGANASTNSTVFSVAVEFDAGGLLPAEFWRQWGDSTLNEFVQGPVWWSGAQGADYPLMHQEFQNIHESDFVKLPPPASPRQYTYTGNSKLAVKEGDKLTAIIRYGYTYFVANSTRVSTSDVTMYTASFMAIAEFDGAGGNVYDNMKVIRRPIAGTAALGVGAAGCGLIGTRTCMTTIASNADVFHSSGVKIGPVVQNSEFSYALDDFFNSHTRVQVSCGPVRSSDSTAGTDVSGSTLRQQRSVARNSTIGGNGGSNGNNNSNGSNGSTASLLIADPRLRNDRGAPDDHPYGVWGSVSTRTLHTRMPFDPTHALA